jgi:hypothetical protein
LGLAALWTSASIAAPSVMRSLHLDPAEKSTEGPFEWIENGLLALCVALWAFVGWQTRDDRLRRAVALAVTLQVALLLGEEIDWGQSFGLGLPGGYRNLRRLLYERWLVSETVGAGVVMAGLGVFFGWPLLPFAAAQRWWDRVAPARAEPGDALALFSLPLLWLVMARIDQGPSLEFVQSGAYLVLGVASLRAARGARAARIAPRAT